MNRHQPQQQHPAPQQSRQTSKAQSKPAASASQREFHSLEHPAKKVTATILKTNLAKLNKTSADMSFHQQIGPKSSSSQAAHRSHSDTQHYINTANNRVHNINQPVPKTRVQSSSSQKARQQTPSPQSQSQSQNKQFPSQLLPKNKGPSAYQSFFQSEQRAALGFLKHNTQSTLQLKTYAQDSQSANKSSKLPIKQKVQSNQNTSIQIQSSSQLGHKQPNGGSAPSSCQSQSQVNYSSKSTPQQVLNQMQQQRKLIIKQPVPLQRARQQFLNVDAKTNQLLLELIKPTQQEYDFEGPFKFVINASELCNQDLFNELYQCSHTQLQLDQQQQTASSSSLGSVSHSQEGQGNHEAIMQAKLDNIKFTQPQQKPRSRNAGGMLKAGQSIQTLSFFDTKPESGAHHQQDDFYSIIKAELQMQTDEVILQLMTDYQPAKFSTKRNGVIAGYGANTNQGISRNYNEDRVAIILNIMKPKQKVYEGAVWPKCSFFGVYDGHGGNVCADFLRDYLHQLIIKDDAFPANPIEAIRNGFAEAEKLYLEFALSQEHEIGEIERSGSCATAMLVVDDICYIANTGDSRAVMSVNGGKQVLTLSNDHKPTDPIEVERILKNGGQIYQNASVLAQPQNTQIILGPHRVFPGRLSVCRTFGDVEAKAEHLLGNPKVVIAEPDICQFKIDPSKHDFVVLGCDGIFDKFDDKDCVHTVWQNAINQDNFQMALELKSRQQRDEMQPQYSHQLCGEAVDSVLKSTALRRSADNITVVFVAFDNFFNLVRQSQGDVTKFEHKKIELQTIDLLQPPAQDTHRHHPPAKNNEIFIDDTNHSHLTSAYGVPGDTGDHQFSKLGQSRSQEEHLSDIAEEDAISMISERLLRQQRQSQMMLQQKQPVQNHKKQAAQQVQRPSSTGKTPQQQNTSLTDTKRKNLNTSQSVLDPIKSMGKLMVPSQALSSLTKGSMLQSATGQHNSRSMPKYLPLQDDQSQSLSQTMPYQSQKQPSRAQQKQSPAPRNFYTEPSEPNQSPAGPPTHQQANITVLKPGSAKRRKVFVKTIPQSNPSGNIASQFLTQVKQQSVLGSQQSQGQASQPKSRNGQFQSYFIPKAWASVTSYQAANDPSMASQMGQPVSAQTFQGGLPSQGSGLPRKSGGNSK